MDEIAFTSRNEPFFPPMRYDFWRNIPSFSTDPHFEEYVDVTSCDPTTPQTVSSQSQPEVVDVVSCGSTQEASIIDLTDESDDVDNHDGGGDIVDLTAANDSFSPYMVQSQYSYIPYGPPMSGYSREFWRQYGPMRHFRYPNVNLPYLDGPQDDDDDISIIDVETVSETQTTPPKRKEQHSYFCPICFETKEKIEKNKKRWMSTLCGHVFCEPCITTTLMQNSCCPTCRKVMSFTDIHPIYF